MVNDADDIIAYETGRMPEKKMLKFFQKLVDSGLVWKMQGSYGKTAHDLLQRGLIKFPVKRTYDYYGTPVPTRAEMKKKIKKVM